ncbi:MAG: twin-arginine translocation signal domain-containing protein [Candidatus Elarobacter sp.]
MLSRRGFLDGAAGVAGAAAAGPAQPSRPAGPYDLPAIEAQLAKPARHRQVFAVQRVGDGHVLGMMRNALVAYEETLREGSGALHVAAVLYANGAPLGLDDAAWRTYRLADASARRGDPIGRHGDGNPFLHDGSGSVEALTRRGASFFVCDNALGELATFLSAIAATTGDDPATVRADLRRHLVPGALLVPAGIATLNAAQEARFTFAPGA